MMLTKREEFASRIAAGLYANSSTFGDSGSIPDHAIKLADILIKKIREDAYLNFALIDVGQDEKCLIPSNMATGDELLIFNRFGTTDRGDADELEQAGKLHPSYVKSFMLKKRGGLK